MEPEMPPEALAEAPVEEEISWASNLEALGREAIPQARVRYYVGWVEAFQRHEAGRPLTGRGPDDVERFLREVSERPGMELWRLRQAAKALRIFYRDVLGRQSGHLPHAAALRRDPYVGGGVRYPDRPGTARPFGRLDHHDLYACPESSRAGSPQPAGRGRPILRRKEGEPPAMSRHGRSSTRYRRRCRSSRPGAPLATDIRESTHLHVRPERSSCRRGCRHKVMAVGNAVGPFLLPDPEYGANDLAGVIPKAPGAPRNAIASLP